TEIAIGQRTDTPGYLQQRRHLRARRLRLRAAQHRLYGPIELLDQIAFRHSLHPTGSVNSRAREIEAASRLLRCARSLSRRRECSFPPQIAASARATAPRAVRRSARTHEHAAR